MNQTRKPHEGIERIIKRENGQRIRLKIKKRDTNVFEKERNERDEFSVALTAVEMSKRARSQELPKKEIQEESDRISKLIVSMIEFWRNDLKRIEAVLKETGWRGAMSNRRVREAYTECAKWLVAGKDPKEDIIYMATGIKNEVFVKEWKKRITGAIKEYKRKVRLERIKRYRGNCEEKTKRQEPLPFSM